MAIHSNRAEPVDIDLHGIVGIRLHGASRWDVDRLTERIGRAPSRLQRPPEIEIEFVDRLTRDPAATIVGETEFSADGTMISCGVHGAAAIPLSDVGGRCRLYCRTGSKSIPLLRSIINLTALANGGLPLHASSFAVEGRGFLASGWAGGGKTATLLAMMSGGADFISDDWTYVSPDGRRLCGLQQPLEVKQRYLDELPDYRTRIGARTRTAIRIAKSAQTLTRWMYAAIPRHDLPPAAMLRRICDKTLSARISPAELFDADRCIEAAEADAVLLTCGHRGSDVEIETLDSGCAVRSIAASLEAESGRLLECYRRLRFAFPAARNSLIDDLASRRRERLSQFLTGRAIYLVRHPSPPSITALRGALRPIVGNDRVTSSHSRGDFSSRQVHAPSPLVLG